MRSFEVGPLEALTQQLAAAVRLGGRHRPAGSAAGRARSTVRQRLRAGLQRIAVQHPGLADHLSARVRTGTICAYQPDSERPVSRRADGGDRSDMSTPVTLLFTDLVSSTELLQRVGDERAQRIFHAHHRLLKDTVAAHGGQEVKWLGDGPSIGREEDPGPRASTHADGA